MNKKSQSVLLGTYDLKDAKHICELLDKHQIAFELEIDDLRIRNMPAYEAGYGGTYGFGASANVYVSAEVIETCLKLIN